MCSQVELSSLRSETGEMGNAELHLLVAVNTTALQDNAWSCHFLISLLLLTVLIMAIVTHITTYPGTQDKPDNKALLAKHEE